MLSRSSIPRLLLAWYRANRRDLPWRKTSDPYAIWVSEIMLQQTRVEAVIPYYERFLGRFPDVASLARAPLDRVLSLWSGLGYYQRARSLHSAAGEVMARYNGKIPEGFDQIRSLKGIGRYTAGAILSIAYGKSFPVLDGNVVRVFSRLFKIHGDLSESENQKKLWALAESLLPQSEPGDFNQALMELGATICTPRSPRCGACPLKKGCAARHEGLQDSLPEKRKKAASRFEEIHFACLEKKGRYLVVARLESPMKGMWEFPLLEVSNGMGGKFSAAGNARHSIMDRRIRASYYRGTFPPGRKVRGKWIAPGKSYSIPVTTLTKKGLALLSATDPA